MPAHRTPTISLQLTETILRCGCAEGMHRAARGRPVQVRFFGQRSFHGAGAFSTIGLPGCSGTLPRDFGLAHSGCNASAPLADIDKAFRNLRSASARLRSQRPRQPTPTPTRIKCVWKSSPASRSGRGIRVFRMEPAAFVHQYRLELGTECAPPGRRLAKQLPLSMRGPR